MELDFLTDQVLTRCDELAQFSETTDCLTRRFLTPPMRQVHECLSRWMQEAGLQVRIDAIGNVIGRRTGPAGASKVFLVGSHVDTVPDAGKFDGILGVMLGITAAGALAGTKLRCHLDVVAFSEEEGMRFRTPYLGSLALCGQFDPAFLDLTDSDGVTLALAVADFGLDPANIAAAAYPANTLAGYFEAHIEQGPILDSLNRPLGIVEAIVGQSRLRLTFAGRAGHAGTTPMENRRDALAGAAEFITRLERLPLTCAGLRVTVGSVQAKPGAINVIAGEASLSLDLRHADDVERHSALVRALQLAKDIAAARKLECYIETIADQAAAPCDPELTSRLEQSLRMAGDSPFRMVSGAGHDAAVMAGHCPAAMLFLRSPGGISHHPHEAVFRNDVRAALDVMIQFLRQELAAE